MRKEIPILFSTAMVQAILDGRKSQTRRVVSKDAQINDANVTVERLAHFRYKDNTELFAGVKPKWETGDVLYVREAVKPKYVKGCLEEFKVMYPGNHPWFYKADGDSEKGYGSWRPAIHMPKEAARIWLEVVSVRVERLLDISEVDAIAEGIAMYKEDGRNRYKDYTADASGYGHPDHDYPTVGIAKTSFCTLWEKINGRDSWDANPWVWVVEFKVLSTNGKPADL